MPLGEERAVGHAENASMFRTAILFATLALLLIGCAGNAAQDNDCARLARGDLRWGYYPGYGCGPVPPAQTKFS